METTHPTGVFSRLIDSNHVQKCKYLMHGRLPNVSCDLHQIHDSALQTTCFFSLKHVFDTSMLIDYALLLIIWKGIDSNHVQMCKYLMHGRLPNALFDVDVHQIHARFCAFGLSKPLGQNDEPLLTASKWSCALYCTLHILSFYLDQHTCESFSCD